MRYTEIESAPIARATSEGQGEWEMDISEVEGTASSTETVPVAAAAAAAAARAALVFLHTQNEFWSERQWGRDRALALYIPYF